MRAPFAHAPRRLEHERPASARFVRFACGILLLFSPLLVAANTQTADQILDQALRRQLETPSEASIAYIRYLPLTTLLRAKEAPARDTRYHARLISWIRKEVLTRKASGDWAISIHSQGYETENLSFSSSGRLFLKKGTEQSATIASPADYRDAFVLRPVEPSNIERELETFVAGEDKRDLVHACLLPGKYIPRHNPFGLAAARVEEVEVAPDGTKTYRIGAKLLASPSSLPVLVWIDADHGKITRIAILNSAAIKPIHQPEDSGERFSMSFTEIAYDYDTRSELTDEDFSRFAEKTPVRIPPIDQSRFLDVGRLVGHWEAEIADIDYAFNPMDVALRQKIQDGNGLLKDDNVVALTGEGNRGSGFKLRLRGGDYVATNLAYLDSPNPVVLTSNNSQVPYTALFGVAGRDVALFRITTSPGSLLPADDAEIARMAGRLVVVGGEHSGDATGYHARLKHLEPERFAIALNTETGGPIVSLETGRVLGISSRIEMQAPVRTDWLTNRGIHPGNPAPIGIAYRLDAAATYPIEWPKWVEQRRQINRITARSNGLIQALRLNPGGIRDEPLAALTRDFLERNPWTRPGDEVTADARLFLRRLRELATEDMESLQKTTFYDYYHTSRLWKYSIPAQQDYRASILRILETQMADPALVMANLGRH